MAAWIFQGNPKYYDVVGAVTNLDQITWSTKQYAKEIKKGDRAYIWLSGADGGIIAAGTILCDPEMKTPEPDPYDKVQDTSEEPYLGVDIRIDHKLTEAIVARTLLLADERTKGLAILRVPNATNFRVTPVQADVIESIIAGRYEKVPATSIAPEALHDEKQYWMYAPGAGSHLWDELYTKEIMAIGWDELGDLKAYPSKEAMKAKMKTLWGAESSYKNDGHATWQFANELKAGDVIFVKKGMKKIIGRGIVTSDYRFDESRDKYCHVRKVKWTHKGDWDHNGQAVMKTLTNITPYTDYCKSLEAMVAAAVNEDPPEVLKIEKYDRYTEEDFLAEVFMSQEQYTTVKNLLHRKKEYYPTGSAGRW